MTEIQAVNTEPVDVLLAMNFSYWLLQDRASLKKYFKSVHAALNDDGVFFLDAYGGYDSHKEIVEKREIDDGAEGFTYIWEQAAFNPIDGTMDCHIPFRFPDKSRMDRAFSYHWRLWTLPETCDLLKECGFSKVVVYWEGTDKDGEPNGIYKPSRKGDLAPAWVAYIIAIK